MYKHRITLDVQIAFTWLFFGHLDLIFNHPTIWSLTLTVHPPYPAHPMAAISSMESLTANGKPNDATSACRNTNGTNINQQARSNASNCQGMEGNCNTGRDPRSDTGKEISSTPNRSPALSGAFCVDENTHGSSGDVPVRPSTQKARPRASSCNLYFQQGGAFSANRGVDKQDRRTHGRIGALKRMDREATEALWEPFDGSRDF
jgi:hypothetical protein